MSDVRYESEDIEGRHGVVVYTMPEGMPEPASEGQACDLAVAVNWEFE